MASREDKAKSQERIAFVILIVILATAAWAAGKTSCFISHLANRTKRSKKENGINREEVLDSNQRLPYYAYYPGYIKQNPYDDESNVDDLPAYASDYRWKVVVDR